MITKNKVEEIAKQVHELRVQYSRLLWTQYTTGYDFGVQEQYTKIVKALTDKANYETILSYMDQDLSSIEMRKTEILHNSFKKYHQSEELNELDLEIQNKVNELSKILNTFRYKFQGKEVSSVELSQILSTDENRDRRKEAFLARNQINQQMVKGGFIDLINLRKDYAKAYGANDFVSYMLEQNELEPTLFDSWLTQLHEALPAMNQNRSAYANEFLKCTTIMAWDEQYLDSKIAPSLNSPVDMSSYFDNIQELFHLFGIDINHFNITYDIFPRANKSEWGYNFPVETAKDSRILANVKNKYFEYGVLLHETGHAVHSFLLDPDEILLNEGVSGIISEGIANLFQSFLYSPVFFGKFFDSGVETEFTQLKEFRKQNSLRAINRIFFDHRLYTNSLSSLDDINQLYWKNQQEVLKEESFGEEPPWGYVIHFTTHPIYLHNYFIGDVTCEMLSNVFKRKSGGGPIDKPKQFGEFLINEVINPSGLYKYNDLFKRISGEDFSLKYML